MPHHDLLILGGGSGNTIIGPEHDDWDVGIAEPAEFGGTCMNRGCIPSKMLVHAADVSLAARTGGRLGLRTSAERADWPAVRRRIFGRIDAIAEGGLAYRESLDNVTVYRHHARFTDERTVDLGGEEVTADRIVLAIGARSSIPPFPGLDAVPYRTSDDVMRVDELPEHLVVLGGGFIALEMAHVFDGLGSRVTIVHRGELVLRGADDDIRRRLTAAYAERLDLRLGATVDQVAYDAGGFHLALSDGSSLDGDQLLVATGRIPNGDRADVVVGGIEVDGLGYVVTDDRLRTTAEGVWALGDVTNPVQLKHTANDEARLVAGQLVNPNNPTTIDRRVVPHAVFGHPQVGSVGATEGDLVAAGRPFVAATRDYAATAYGWAMEDTTGFAKVLADPETRLLLGAHVLGPQAPTLVQQLVQGMAAGLTVDQMASGQLWIHPAMPELLEQALLEL
ncbi:MAG: mycothione reductase [Acidimicrobiaceae bacterium]|nr:mycothione reductase [Acidimicrobiaceae bacterium]